MKKRSFLIILAVISAFFLLFIIFVLPFLCYLKIQTEDAIAVETSEATEIIETTTESTIYTESTQPPFIQDPVFSRSDYQSIIFGQDPTSIMIPQIKIGENLINPSATLRDLESIGFSCDSVTSTDMFLPEQFKLVTLKNKDLPNIKIVLNIKNHSKSSALVGDLLPDILYFYSDTNDPTGITLADGAVIGGYIDDMLRILPQGDMLLLNDKRLDGTYYYEREGYRIDLIFNQPNKDGEMFLHGIKFSYI